MSQGTLLLLSAALIGLALAMAVLAWVSSLRWVRQYREAMQQAVHAKEQAIEARDERLAAGADELAALKEEVAFLKELESVRFAERYLETKGGLEHRAHRLESHMARTRERAREFQSRLDELALSRDDKAGEIARLRSELAKTQQDSRTLEQALQAVSTVGSIPITDIQKALARRRRRQAAITARLEQLGLEGERKAVEVERLRTELDRTRRDIERLTRDLEITRAAGPILDSLLGVTAEMREKMGRIESRLEASMGPLTSGTRRDPIAEFLEAASGATRERSLLLAAAGRNRRGEDTAADPEDDEGAEAEEGAADAEGGRSDRDTARAAPVPPVAAPARNEIDAGQPVNGQGQG